MQDYRICTSGGADADGDVSNRSRKQAVGNDSTSVIWSTHK
jgi:hypothetical protein